VLVVAILMASPAPGAAGTPVKSQTITLPTKWKVGARYRYRATWTRRATLPGELSLKMNTDHEDQIEITVVAKAGAGYRVRWEPQALAAPAPPPAKGDTSAAGNAIWAYMLTRPLDLTVEPGAVIEIRNAGAVRAQLSRRLREISRDAGVEIDCEKADAPRWGCTLVATEEKSSVWIRFYTQALFSCAGMQLETGPAVTWSEPHPDPSIGDAVSIQFSREVVAFDPRSPSVTIKTVTEPNAQEMQAWMRRTLGDKVAAGPVAKMLDQMTFRFETVCTVDRRSGWPTVVEGRTIGGLSSYSGVETSRFELVDSH